MKKRTLILTMTLAICLILALLLSACNSNNVTPEDTADKPQTDDWIFTADNLEEAEDIYEDFIYLSAYDDNLIVTVSDDDGVFLTETIKDETDHIDYMNGEEYYLFRDDEDYICAFNGKRSRYFFIDEEEYFDHFMEFYFYLDVLTGLPEGTTVSLTSKGTSTHEEYNIYIDATLTLKINYDDTEIDITATKVRNKVTYFKSTQITADETNSITMNFSYGSASVTIPDITDWYNASAPQTESDWYVSGRLGGEDRDTIPMYYEYLTGCYRTEYVDVIIGDDFTVKNKNDPSLSYSMNIDEEYLTGREMVVFDPNEEDIYFASDGGFHYLHDPRKNPYAMADIVEDQTAIYGFRPGAEGSLAIYATADWSDAEIVEKGRQERIDYHRSLESMYTMLDEMTAQGKSVEEIARAISTERNQIRLDSYKDDPEGLAALKKRNLDTYGHEEGPLPDELYQKYGSWEKVISKAFSANSGMDACLGLYDTYYDLYVAVGQID